MARFGGRAAAPLGRIPPTTRDSDRDLRSRGGIPAGLPERWTSRPSVWLQSRAPLEYLGLRRHPVLPGDGLPHGDGRPVLLVPGFMSGDRSLTQLQRWLRRMGYQAEAPGLIFNVRRSEAVLATLVLRTVDLYGWFGRPVTIVGHSRGGLLAKVLADRHPEMVDQVIGLGSPFADPYDVHPVTMAGVRVAQALNAVRFGRTGEVERRFLLDLGRASRVPLTSIYSRSDGIVRWQACLRPDATCLEVTGSHVGLAVNREVYALIARLLATGPRRAGRVSAPA